MNTKETYLVQMDYGYGKSDKSWLEAEIHNDTIFFKRNKDGVHAWHCNAVNIKDHRVLDIKPQSQPCC
ncbi:MAG: hypothetical protein KDC67_06320 [Ignavibacteriae bacterium]|nr:hypothetical protein [Ignavibacteriota bacterium]